MVKPETVEKIRDKTDILSIISSYVPLKQRGRNHIGLCPFHSEKTPSFTVSVEKQMFHCFGCGEGGDAITFLMKIDNLSFIEAVEQMAQKVGVTIEKDSYRPTSKEQISTEEKNDYYQIMSLAAQLYQNNLLNEKAKIAKQYIEQRELSEEVIKKFEIGYALPNWDNLLNNLTSRGIKEEVLSKLGLAQPRKGQAGYYDYFRDRIIFPIKDARGRVIGLGGRGMTQEVQPKYINSPDSPIFNKGANLYGLDLAKDSIKKKDQAILVEGYLDVITGHQFGFDNMIAPLGTAFTTAQAKILLRYTKNIIVAFDSDEAGEKAILRCIEIFNDLGVKIKCLTSGLGKDPDEIIRKAGKDEYAKLIDEAKYWTKYKIDIVLRNTDKNEIESRTNAIHTIANLLSQEKDPLIKDEYLKYVAQSLNINYDTISSEVKRRTYTPQRSGQNRWQKRQADKPIDKIVEAEKNILKLSLNSVETFMRLKEHLHWGEFTNIDNQKIAETIWQVDYDKNSFAHDIMKSLPTAELKKIFTSLIVDDQDFAEPEKVFADCLSAIKEYHLELKMKDIQKQMREAEERGDFVAVKNLHTEFNEYFKIIRQRGNQ